MNGFIPDDPPPQDVRSWGVWAVMMNHVEEAVGWGDEHNFVWLSVLYGFMLDFTRDGFYGPGVVLFIIFYLVRFRTDVIMDMTKVHYRVLLFSSMSMVYCMYNLFLTSYTLESALPVAIYRSVVNISIVFIISSFFKGYSIAVKNS